MFNILSERIKNAKENSNKDILDMLLELENTEKECQKENFDTFSAENFYEIVWDKIRQINSDHLNSKDYNVISKGMDMIDELQYLLPPQYDFMEVVKMFEEVDVANLNTQQAKEKIEQEVFPIIKNRCDIEFAQLLLDEYVKEFLKENDYDL